MKIEIERGDEIGRGDEDTQNEAKKERGDEIERGWGLGHGERNRGRGRTDDVSQILFS